jgi:hypothetical protein
MLAGRIAPALDGTLFRHAARAFQKQFLAFTATQPTDWTAILCHLLYLRFSGTPFMVCPLGSDSLLRIFF